MVTTLVKMMMMIMIITSQNFGTIQNGANKFKSTKKKKYENSKMKGKIYANNRSKIRKGVSIPSSRGNVRLKQDLMLLTGRASHAHN